VEWGSRKSKEGPVKSRILNVADAPIREQSHGDQYAARIAMAGTALASKMIGFNVTVIPPGKKAFPYHAHRGNEEMFFVLEGEGAIRLADREHRIRAGDFISLPPGRDSAHQIINDSDAPLRYLAVSTMLVPEVVEYPDSHKVGVIAGGAGARPPEPDSLRHFTRLRDAVDYWDGE
jgi:uncharacterized cupin superfamily protein